MEKNSNFMNALRASRLSRYLLLPLHKVGSTPLFTKSSLFVPPHLITRNSSSETDRIDEEEDDALDDAVESDDVEQPNLYDQKELDEQLAQLSFTVKDKRIFHDDFILNQAAKANVLHAEKARRKEMEQEEEVEPANWADMPEDQLDAASFEEQEMEAASKKTSVDDWWREYLKEKEGVGLSVGERMGRINRLSVEVATRAQAEQAGDSASPYERETEFQINEVIQLGFHAKLTVGGRINSHSALVLIGTGKGTAGMSWAHPLRLLINYKGLGMAKGQQLLMPQNGHSRMQREI